MNQPAVCKQAAKTLQRQQHLSLGEEGDGDTAMIYPSQASCCRPGLGAFPDGCKFDA